MEWRRLLFTLILAAGSLVPRLVSAFEEGAFRYPGTECAFFEQRDGKWQKSPSPLVIDEIIQGRVLARSSKQWITFSKSQKRWIAPERCFSEVKQRSSTEWILGGLSWSESFTGIGELGGITALSSRLYLSRIGLAWHRPSPSGIELGLEGSILFGLGKASDPTGQVYSASGWMGGFLLSPSLNWRPGSQRWGLGLSTPLILRRASWPDSGLGLTLPAALGLRTGLAAKVTRRGERFSFAVEAGALANTSQWLFSLTVGFPF